MMCLNKYSIFKVILKSTGFILVFNNIHIVQYLMDSLHLYYIHSILLHWNVKLITFYNNEILYNIKWTELFA